MTSPEIRRLELDLAIANTKNRVDDLTRQINTLLELRRPMEVIRDLEGLMLQAEERLEHLLHEKELLDAQA